MSALAQRRILRWSAPEVRALEEAARQGYPLEVCGLLIGRNGGAGVEIVGVTRAANLDAQRPHDRYTLNPEDFLRADRDARAAGLDIVGIWHTHPDHPARPSQTDLDAAWEGYVYVIAAVTADGVRDITAWELNGPEFTAVAIEEDDR